MSPKAFQFRCIFLCSALVVGLSLLSVQLIRLQVWERKKYAARAAASNSRSEILRGQRGTITDRNEEVLAKTIALSSLHVDAVLLNDPTVIVRALAYKKASAESDWSSLTSEQQFRKLRGYGSVILEETKPEKIVADYRAHLVGVLARPLGMRREELLQSIERPIKLGRKDFSIVKDLPEDVADNLRGLIAENHLKGFHFQNKNKRWYPSPTVATHVIGYQSEEEYEGPTGKKEFRQVGKFGVEAAMEEYLRGTDGVWHYQSIPMPGQNERLVPPVHGLNVQLTIDMGIQTIVEEELDAGLKEFKADTGCVIVLEPGTGEVLAMVSRPDFHLNTKVGLDTGAMNYALQGTYEPGSTFKVVGVAGALNERLVNPNTQIFCHHGYFQEGKLRIPDHHPYGMLPVWGVLQKSSNIGSFKIARQLGVKRFYEYADRFGFGHETGILLSGESSGLARNTDNLIDFSRATYGYAVNVTPLQVASAYATIANGGELIRPRVIRKITANDGTVLERYKPEVVRRVMRESTARQLREALVTVVEQGGTATLAAVDGFKAAGKTGTAKRVENGRYQEGHYTVSFAGMMPAKDPAFVCLVVVDDPLTNEVKRYGGTIAAPIFSKIASRVATHMNLTPTEPVSEEVLVETR